MQKRWSDEELELLRSSSTVDAYMKEALRRSYPYRTPRAVARQREVQGLTKNNLWSEDELDILREVYAGGNVEEVVAALRDRGYTRSEGAIRTKITQLGLTGLGKSPRWSEEEEDILIEYYPWATANQVRTILKSRGFNRTVKAIDIKANTLDVRKGEDYYT